MCYNAVCDNKIPAGKNVNNSKWEKDVSMLISRLRWELIQNYTLSET